MDKNSPSYGIVTGVNYITIQNDTGYNTVGTVSGGALGGITGHTLTGQRQAIVGVAAAGVLAGQAIQRRLARSQLVELFIRPTDGRDFVIVQPTRGTPFFVGQKVKVAYRRGNIVILPG
jgi:outer membrane lipoprotein SlyB